MVIEHKAALWKGGTEIDLMMGGGSCGLKSIMRKDN